MKLKTLGHALCSLGTTLAGSGVHSHLFTEWIPRKYTPLVFISGMVFKGSGHIILWIASILDKPIQVSEATKATVNTTNLTLVTQER